MYVQYSLLCILFIAALQDIRTKKIPNKILFLSFLIVVIALMLDKTSLPVIGKHICAVIAVFFAGYILQHYIGMADIKLFMLLALAIPASHFYSTLVFAFCFFLCFHMLHELIQGKNPKRHIQNVFYIVKGIDPDLSNSESYPFAPFVLIGYCITLIGGPLC